MQDSLLLHRVNTRGREWLKMGKKPKKTENKDAGFQTQLAEKMDLK